MKATPRLDIGMSTDHSIIFCHVGGKGGVHARGRGLDLDDLQGPFQPKLF